VSRTILLEAVKQQIAENEHLKKKGEFVPHWKNLSTWINNSCWEIESQILSSNKKT
jgi:hypothetical protein